MPGLLHQLESHVVVEEDGVRGRERYPLLCRLVPGTLLLAAILVPFILWEERITAATDTFLREPRMRFWTAGGLAGLLAADVVLPIPSSLVNTAAGNLLGFWGGTATAWTGLMVGCGIGYLLGRAAVQTPLQKLVGPMAMKRLAGRLDIWGVVLFRAIPVLAEASIVYAGFRRMPVRRFLVVCCFSNLGMAAAYAGIGAWAAGAGSFLLAFTGATFVPLTAFGIAQRFWGETRRLTAEP